jgi:hypothetical protein
MGKLIFDYEDGDLIHTLSDQTAMDMDGHLMMRMSDNMVMDMDSGEIHLTSRWDNDDDE